ncbi:MAG: ABC1 kinase family protein [Pseudomonadota bacterium]
MKLGQALSLRRDILPDAYVVALRDLQDRVAPFPGKEAKREIERALGGKLKELFSEYDPVPLAAASIAQVHRARMPDGRPVIVKVRRPNIAMQIERDMRALVTIVRIGLRLAPDLERFRPVRLVEEIWANLRKETDFRQEARNIRRFVEAFRGWETINIPGVVDDLYSESVLVQEMSHGRNIDDPAVRADGPRLAQIFVDAYLHQFFVVGLFHGDPHPGNLFVMEDGRICFHDFGLVGFLDRNTRRGLAMFLHAFVRQDAGWVLDAAIDLGLLGGNLDRSEFQRGIEEILSDYAALPLKDWSLAEALLRVMRLGSGENFAIPHNLLVLMRTMFLAENAIRTLDPEFRILDSLIARGQDALNALLREGPSAAPTARLKNEAAATLQDLPGLLGAWLHKTVKEGGRLTFTLRHEGLDTLELHIDRSGNRVALALVTLGLYVAASLLMLHSIGPRLFGEMPVLAAAGYGLALWFTLRLARGIRRSGRL